MTLKICLDIINDDEKIKYICKALSKETRIEAIKVLYENGKLTLDEFHSKAKIHKNVETSYRNLEKLVDANLLKKEYDNVKKKLTYTINHKLFE